MDSAKDFAKDITDMDGKSDSYSQPPTSELTDIQKRVRASEKDFNFRWIAYFASSSKTPLTARDKLQDRAIYEFIAQIGQYSEIAHGSIKTSFVFDHLKDLYRPGFPLEGYDALINDDPILVKYLEGTVDQLQYYMAFRPKIGQLVVAISGTSNLQQTRMNLDFRFAQYPEGGAQIKVHSGFWTMYESIRESSMEALRTGLERFGESVTDIVVTGHSMGGTLSYLLMLDIMKDLTSSVGGMHDIISQRCLPKLKLRLVVFGAPRAGNEALSQYWTQCINDYRGGDENLFQEYSLKTNEDGMCAHILPPHFAGYRHLTQSPIYLFKGNLYRIPPSDKEYGALVVKPQSTTTDTVTPMSDSDMIGSDPHRFSWPLGGHNYYFRDMESLQRRIKWLELSSKGEEGWKKRYEAKLEEWEKRYGVLPTDTVSQTEAS